MRLKKWQLSNFRIYLILDKAACGKKDTKIILEEALKGGVDIVQFRDKFSTTKAMIKEAYALSKICKKFKTPFIINDRIDVAIAINSDGLHLGQDDMPINLARKILGSKKLIGLSCHSLKDVLNAQNKKIDYLGFGPIFKTATKPKMLPMGTKDLKKALKKSRFPIFAIGGICLENINEVLQAEATGIAVCRQLCCDKNITQTTRILKERMLKCTLN